MSLPLVWSSIIACVSVDPKIANESSHQIRQMTTAEHDAMLQSMAKKFPTERYLATWGSGSSLIEAVNQGRVEIASRINSEITAKSRSRRSLKGGAGVPDSSETEVSVDVTSTSTFKHGELIGESESGRHSFDGSIYAFVSLKKSEISDVLNREYEVMAQPFRISCQRISTASQRRDRQALCSEKQGFEAQAPTVTSLADQWFAIFRRYSEHMTSDDQCMQKALASLAQSAIPRLLTVDASAVEGGVQESLVTSIRRLGTKISFKVSEGQSCTSGLLLRLRARVGCSPGQLGTVCQMSAHGDMLDCATNPQSIGSVALGMAKGISMSDDRIAMERLIKNVGSLNLQSIANRLEEEATPCAVKQGGPLHELAH